MNISDIAKKARVSTATVSRVINGSTLVKPETRDKVLQIIAESGYTPSAVAKSLSVRTTHTVGVVIPDIENPFFSSAMISIARVAESHLYNVAFFSSEETLEREHNALYVARQQRLDGVILAPCDGTDPVTRSTLEEFERQGVAVVLLDRDLEGGGFSVVLTEDQKGSCDAVRQLIRAGHRRIAAITGVPSHRPISWRLTGYRQALEEAGIPFREEYVVRADQQIDLACEMTGALLDLPEPPTAIFTCSNMMTLGCLRYCTGHGIVPGRDLGLVGFDEIEVLRDVGLRLSVVHRSPREMGRIAMELLLKRLEQPDGEKETVIVPTELILRGSERCRGVVPPEG